MAIKVGEKQSGGMDEINVTPLIDIVLVLLIIFMVLTPITIQKMASNLPPPDVEEPPPPDTPPDQLMVAVYEDGTLALNLKAGADLDIKHEVAQRLRSKDKKTVFVDAHPKANYGRVVLVMDMLREAGAEKVGLAELKDEGPARLDPSAALPAPATPATPAAVP